ncbi:MAG: CBS domain-containing protein [Chitinivibrionia bacterium]|nr:CBS domain-containing protein [Chitinivibrionia bacterium]
MRTVAHILKAKGNLIYSTAPESTVYDALRLMAEKDVGALLVMNGDSVGGIFSERDYARKVILKGKTSKDTLVREIMSEKVLYVTPEQSLEECMAIMTEKHIRHFPVMDGGKPAGFISIGDVVKGVISQQQFVIEQLQKYITGAR